jgi:hypothetical protein
MRNAGGYAFIVNPTPGKIRLDGGRVDMACEGITEYDSFTCGHCNCVRHVRARERPEDLGGLCKSCMKLICPAASIRAVRRLRSASKKWSSGIIIAAPMGRR